MVTLATQSANGTYDDSVDRANLQKEVASLKDEIDRIADSANFNGINLLDGTQAGAIVTMDKWGDESSSTYAKMTLDLGTRTGKDLIGGKITVGTKTFSIVEATGTMASTSAAFSDDKIKVGKNATASTIAAAFKSAIGSTITVKLANGSETTMSVAASNGKIVFTATASTAKGVSLDALSLPNMEVKAGLKLQIGDTSKEYNQIRTGINDIHVSSLFIDSVDISTQDEAAKAVDRIKNAINMVSSTRGDLGAIQNRLEHTANNLSVMTENIQDAESTIRDTDIAEEMMSYTKNNILVQSAQAMLAQANTVPQGVLQLLQ
jgi:flagellin